LSVQHLGSIYERLLEHDVAENAAAGVVLQPSLYARKASGSFYTREELVALILRRPWGRCCRNAGLPSPVKPVPERT
jgi:hypothetical protein